VAKEEPLVVLERLVTREVLDKMENPVRREPKVRKAQLALKELLEMLVQQGKKVKTEPLVRLALKASKDPQDLKAEEGKKGLQDLEVIQEDPERKVRREIKDPKGNQVRMASVARKGTMARKVHRVPKVMKVTMVQLAPQGQQVILVVLVLLALKDPKDPRANLVLAVLQALRGQMEPQGTMDSLVQ